MGFLSALLAFLATPLGTALGKAIPDLADKIVTIWVQRGKVTPEQIADYIEAEWLDPNGLVKPRVP